MIVKALLEHKFFNNVQNKTFVPTCGCFGHLDFGIVKGLEFSA
jgi:hypothetical protein